MNCKERPLKFTILPIVDVNATVDHEVIGPPAAVKNIEFPIPILRGWSWKVTHPEVVGFLLFQLLFSVPG